MKKNLILLFVLCCLGFATQATASELIGIWHLTTVETEQQTYENLKAIFIFEKGGLLKSARTSQSEPDLAGNWKFDKKRNIIIMISELDKDFDGIAKIIEISETKLIYKKDEDILYFERLKELDLVSDESFKTVENDIERLKFRESDFFDENGDYKYYEDEIKLPWQDADAKLISLGNVNQLVYTFSTLEDDNKVFKKDILIANVNSNPAEQSLIFDYIFYGFDRNNLPEDTEMPINTDYFSLLYPEEDNAFRFFGTELITTKAGTFDCTVIEVISTFDTYKKLWMINDKPGIYARIISDKPGPFGQYSIYELQEIKLKE